MTDQTVVISGVTVALTLTLAGPGAVASELVRSVGVDLEGLC